MAVLPEIWAMHLQNTSLNTASPLDQPVSYHGITTTCQLQWYDIASKIIFRIFCWLFLTHLYQMLYCRSQSFFFIIEIPDWVLKITVIQALSRMVCCFLLHIFLTNIRNHPLEIVDKFHFKLCYKWRNDSLFCVYIHDEIIDIEEKSFEHCNLK